MEIRYVGLNSLQFYDSEIKDWIIKQIKDSEKQVIVSADSYLQFPTIGDSTCLYVDVGANTCYRWDDANLKYFKIGSDYNEIEIIDGTGK